MKCVTFILYLKFHCTDIDWGRPSFVVSGDVTFSMTTFGSVAIYRCAEGFVLNPSDETSRIRMCQADGNWFGPNPTCESMLKAKSRVSSTKIIGGTTPI